MKGSIRLRAMEPEDLDVLYQIENDPGTWCVGVVNVPYSRYLLHDYIANATGDIYADKQVRLMIENVEGACVGMVDLVNFDPRHSRAEVGVVIQECYRRRGYATEALRLALDYAREVVHLHQVYVVVSVENEVSLKLFKSLGFEDGAVLKDWLHANDTYREAYLLQYFFQKRA